MPRPAWGALQHELQLENGKLAVGILADADISNRLDPVMVRALLEE